MTRWKNKQDPHAKREADKYDNPVPSREFISGYFEKIKQPLTHRALCAAFELEDDPERVEALRRRLRAMERDGQLMRNRKGAYGLVSKMDLIRGKIQSHKDGFGFVLPDDGSEDLYLTFRQMKSVFDGDVVLARISGEDRKGRREGAIVEVLERNTQQLVGRYYEESGVGFVAPDNPRIQHDILIPHQAKADARNGQFVVAEITLFPSSKNQAQGKIVEVLGEHLAPGMEIDVAIRSHDIPHVWPKSVIEEADQRSAEGDVHIWPHLCPIHLEFE
jgi:ribonuclease R